MGPVIHCNGNGQCFDHGVDTIICPSSKITGIALDLPKGRATFMRGELRLLSNEGVSATPGIKSCKIIPPARAISAAGFFTRSLRCHAPAVSPAKPRDAVPRCEWTCPTSTPSFWSYMHRQYTRPIGDFFTARLEQVLPLMADYHAPVNRSMGSPGWWASSTRRRWIRTLHGAACASTGSTSEDRRTRKTTVIVVQDAFTTFYEPAVLEACCLLLRTLGFEPLVLPWFENGKARHIKGYLRRVSTVAKAAARGSSRPRNSVSPCFVINRPSRSPTAMSIRKCSNGIPVSALVWIQEWLADQTFEKRAGRPARVPSLLALHGAGAGHARRASGRASSSSA